MGSKKTETTQATTIPGIGAQEQQARDILSQLAQGGGDLSANLSDLASGNLQITPQDQALIQQIQRLSTQTAQQGMADNASLAMNTVEGNLLDRGISGSSIEAVNKALIGRQLTTDLNKSALQGQVTSAQQLRQSVLDRAGLKLNANQLLLQKILGASQGMANLGLQERLGQATTTKTQTQSGISAGDIGKLAMRGIAAYATGGASELARAGMSQGQINDFVGGV